MAEKQDPAIGAQIVTPSDTTDLCQNTRAVYVGGTGNLSVVMDGGDNAVIFVGVQGGSVLPIQVQRIKDTGTTATSILALY